MERTETFKYLQMSGLLNLVAELFRFGTVKTIYSIIYKHYVNFILDHFSGVNQREM